jgi:HEPN domain-containing protein
MSNNAHDWLTFAVRDINAGEVNVREDVYYVACFLAQQAAEKALKGFLINNNISHPRTHDLAGLCRLCSGIDNGFSNFKTKLALLTQFYAPTRYPDAAPGITSEGMPSKDTARKALNYARDIVDFCSERV